MSTSVDYIEYVCGQVRGNYSIRYKKMFGEYLVYLNEKPTEKPVLLVCENCVFIKKLGEIESLMQGAEECFPYKGSKPHYILDMENCELVDKVIRILEEITPVPKKRVKKSN